MKFAGLSRRSRLLFGGLLGFFLFTSNGALAASSHAAIAYSMSTLQVGISKAAPSYRAAYDEAMKLCAAPDCFVRAAVRDGCVAFARDEKWEGLGFASGESLADAEGDAMFLCTRPWPNQCRLVISFCSNR